MQFVVSFLAGLGLGAIFFGGLWKTVAYLPRARHPGLLMFASMLLRLGIAVAGIWLVADGQWERIATSLAGMVIVRAVLVRRLRPETQPA